MLVDWRRKRLFVIEVTRAWDRDRQFSAAQGLVKTARYAPWIHHLQNHLEGWTVQQLNLTVGARGSVVEHEWLMMMEALEVPEAKRERLLEGVCGVVLDGLASIFSVFQAAWRLRRAEGGGFA